MTIGQLIKEARKKAGLTQQELANLAGTATGTIQQYELGKRQPRIAQLRKIADALKISISYFLDIPGISNSFEDAAMDYQEMKKDQEINTALINFLQAMYGGYEKRLISCNGVSVNVSVFGTDTSEIIIDGPAFELISCATQGVISSLVSNLGKTADEVAAELAENSPKILQFFDQYKEKHSDS